MNIQEIYEPIDSALRHAGALLDASEAHGVLCGLLCLLEPDQLEGTWFKQVLGEVNNEELVTGIQQQLRLLKKVTIQQLDSLNTEFMPLLPDDDEMISTRIQGIGGWSESFLYGLGIAHLDESQLSVDSQEFIQDVIHLSRIAPDSEEDEQAEENYMQLVEYLKIGTLNLYEECHALNRVTVH